MTIHICMIAGEFPPISGGLGYYTYNLSRELIGRGYKITVLTRGSWNKTHYEILDGISVYRVCFLPVYPFHIQLHGIFINKLFSRIESRFDLLHLHNHGIPPTKSSIPSIVTEHGTAKGFIENLDAIDIFSLALTSFSKMYVSIDSKVIANADKITAVSDSCAKELKLHYGVENVEVVNNGIDTSFFTPNKNNNQNICVLSTSALISKKGLPDLIKSIEYVRKDYPNIKCILTGRGPLERYLKKLVKQLKLEENIMFAGYVNRNELLEYYQNASIFVLPSYHEGLPTTILEAMSCGIPVITTDVPGNSEAVIDGETGLIVPPKDPEKLAASIIKLLNDDVLRAKMGNNGRTRAKRIYDWTIIADRFERIYLDLL